MTSPILWQWTGEALVPASPYHAREADKELVVGERYRMAEVHDRSAKTHNHFFAAVADGWSNLPDRLIETYPTAEHLRKKALIRAGYADERSIVCASKAEAQRVAAFMRPMDDYAIVMVREAVVTVWTAKSQSLKAMGAKEFQASKQAVLGFVDTLIGVERGATEQNAREAA